MLQDSIAHFDREIEILEHFDHANRLPIVIEATLYKLVQRRFARVSECRVAEVVAEADGFGEDFVEEERLRDRARDLRHFQNVREPRAEVIAFRREEHLRLVFETPKRLAVNDSIAIP